MTLSINDEAVICLCVSQKPLKWSVWKNENKSAEDSKGTWYVVDAVCFVYTCRRLIELANDCRYGTSFELPASLPADAQVSVNLTVSTRPAPPARIDLGLLKERLLLRDRPWQGFGQGNLFMNGVHVAYFNTEDGR